MKSEKKNFFLELLNNATVMYQIFNHTLIIENQQSLKNIKFIKYTKCFKHLNIQIFKIKYIKFANFLKHLNI